MHGYEMNRDVDSSYKWQDFSLLNHPPLHSHPPLTKVYAGMERGVKSISWSVSFAIQGQSDQKSTRLKKCGDETRDSRNLGVDGERNPSSHSPFSSFLFYPLSITSYYSTANFEPFHLRPIGKKLSPKARFDVKVDF